MRTAIRKHLGDFIALLVLFVIAVGVGGYILDQQRLRFPLVEEKPKRIAIEMADARAVIPGQGQTVRVAGVKVGDIATVEAALGDWPFFSGADFSLVDAVFAPVFRYFDVFDRRRKTGFQYLCNAETLDTGQIFKPMVRGDEDG